MGGFPVQRVALRVKVSQSAQRVSHLQQRTTGVVAQAAKQFFGRRPQVHDMPPLMQMQPVDGAQDSAAPRRENATCLQGQFINDRFLDIAEAGLPFPLEIVTNRATNALLDDVVGVKKRKLQPPGKLPPDSGFTGAGEADEGYQ